MTIFPIPPQERVEAMDVLRGFALLGVFVVNMLFFAAPYHTTMMRPWPEAAQPWFQAFLLLIWMGDILTIYALLGFLLLLFRTRKPKTLLVWAFSLVGVSALLFVVVFVFLKIGQGIPEVAAKMEAVGKKQDLQMVESTARSLRVYGGGPYGELFRLRAKELAENYAITLSIVPQILAMFLLGAWTSRKGVVKDPEAHQGLITKVLGFGLAFGLLGSAFNLWCGSKGMPGPRNPYALLGVAVYLFATPALTLAYAALVLRLLKGPAAALLKPLAWNGRMALTNYLTHSVVFTTAPMTPEDEACLQNREATQRVF